MEQNAPDQHAAPSPFFSPEGLAAYLGLPVGTIYRWRVKGTGPRGIRIGRHVRYRRSDVDAWVEARAAKWPA